MMLHFTIRWLDGSSSEMILSSSQYFLGKRDIFKETQLCLYYSAYVDDYKTDQKFGVLTFIISDNKIGTDDFIIN